MLSHPTQGSRWGNVRAGSSPWRQSASRPVTLLRRNTTEARSSGADISFRPGTACTAPSLRHATHQDPHGAPVGLPLPPRPCRSRRHRMGLVHRSRLLVSTRARSLLVVTVWCHTSVISESHETGAKLAEGLTTSCSRSWGGCAAVSIILMGRDGRLVSHGLDTLF